jgi:transcriptional regulator with XRE-family HTH domain
MSTKTVERHFPEWTIADRLRRIRRETGLTQEAFAERLQLKGQRYSAWESGRNHPPATVFVSLAERIEETFGVAVEWTLGLEMRNTPRPDGPGGVTDLRARRDSNPKPSDPKVLPLLVAA